MRLNATSRGRECIIPEVNRNYNIGETGATMQRSVYAKYLRHMSLNHVNVKDLGDLTYLAPRAYRRWVAGLVDTSVTWPWHAEPLAGWVERHVAARGGDSTPPTILALYRSENYAKLAARLNPKP